MSHYKKSTGMTPLGAVACGLAAGVIGTAAMTAWQELSARLQSPSSADSGGSGSDQEPSDPWEEASAPAQVAKRIGEGVFELDVSADLIPLLTHATHWGYGTGWGAIYGIVAGGGLRPGLSGGLAFGTVVWLSSYAQLVPMGLYEPPWKYSPSELAMDLSYHLVYGAGVALGYRALDRG